MPDLFGKELLNIEQFITEGLYFKALDALDDFEQEPDHPPEDQVFSRILKSNIFSELGRSFDALKFAEQACNMSQEIGNKPLLIDSYISKALALFELRDLNTISNLLSKGEELLKQLTKIKFDIKSLKEFWHIKAVINDVYESLSENGYQYGIRNEIDEEVIQAYNLYQSSNLFFEDS